MQKVRKFIEKNKKLLVYAGFDLGGKALFFLLPILFAVVIGNEEFGVYSLGMTVVYLLVAIAVQSSQMPYIVLGGEQLSRDEKVNSAFSARLVTVIPLTLLACGLLLLFPDQVSGFAKTDRYISVFMCYAVLGVGIRFIFDGLFLSLSKKILYGVYSFTGAVFGVLYFVGLYLTNNVTVELFYPSFLVANILGAVVLLPFINLKQLLPFSFDTTEIKKLLNHSKWVGLGLVAMNVINWGDNYFFSVFGVAKGDIGVYNFAYQFFKGFILIATSLITFLLPTMVANINNENYLKKYLSQTRWFIIGGWVVLNLFIGVALTSAMQTSYLGQYSEGVGVLWVLILASIFMMYRRIYEPIFNARKQFKFLQASNVILVIVNVGLNIWLIPQFGIMGAAIATMAAYLVLTIFYEYWFWRKT